MGRETALVGPADMAASEIVTAMNMIQMRRIGYHPFGGGCVVPVRRQLRRECQRERWIWGVAGWSSTVGEEI